MKSMTFAALSLVVFIGHLNAQDSTQWKDLKYLGDQYNINGSISVEEVVDTTQMKFVVKSERFFIKKSQDFTYIGIRSNTSTILNTYLINEETIKVLHSSAALGQVNFVKENEIYKPTKTEFDWIYRDPLAWQEMHSKGVGSIQEFYHLFGWMATTWHSGSYREIEMLIENTLITNNTIIVISYTSKEGGISDIRFKMGKDDVSISNNALIDNQLHNGYIPLSINLNKKLLNQN